MNIIAKIGIKGLFSRDLEVSVENFGELGIAFHLCSFLLLVDLQGLQVCEGNKEFNIVGPIIIYLFGMNLGGVLETLLAYGGLN